MSAGRRRGGAGDAVPLESVAEIAGQLAVLLEAGVPPASAFDHAARGASGPARRALRAAARAARAGDAAASALTASAAGASEAWASLAAVIEVATAAGAPMGPSLRAAGAAFTDAAAIRADVSVALAGPRATVRLVSWLPAVSVAFGLLLGFDSLRVLATTMPGWCCAAGGIGLLIAGRRWSAHLVRRATPPAAMPGLLAELVAIGLAGGGSLDRARAAAVAALGSVGPGRAGGDAGAARVDGVLALARSAGAPAVELLRAAAAQERSRARTAGREAAARLGTALMLPMGLCVLPAFLLLGVAPLVLSIVSSTAIGFG